MKKPRVLSFANGKAPPLRKDLEAHHKRQLEVLAMPYEGTPNADYYLGSGPLTGAELWELREGETPVYELWLCDADGGYLFAAGKSRVLAQVLQGGFECEDERVAKEVLGALATAKPTKKTVRLFLLKRDNPPE